MFESENFDNISEINEVLMEFFFRAFEKQSIFVVSGASIYCEWRTNPLKVIDFALWNKMLLATSSTYLTNNHETRWLMKGV